MKENSARVAFLETNRLIFRTEISKAQCDIPEGAPFNPYGREGEIRDIAISIENQAGM